MGKLRHWLFGSLLCATVFLGCALAQSVLTPIRDTVSNSDGSLFNGTVAITWNGPPPTSGTVSALGATAKIYNGALSLLLVPNSNGSTYQAVYTSSDGTVTWTETWDVPASTTALTLSQIRLSGSGNSGSGSGTGTGSGNGSNNYATLPISIDEITDLSSDLNTINASLTSLTTNVSTVTSTANGLVPTVSANSSSISTLAGTVSTLNTDVTNLNSSVSSLTSTVNSLATGNSSVAFIDAETPAGILNGTSATFTLANSPFPSGSLELYRNGVLQTAGVDYTLVGSVITFSGGSIPQTNDLLQAYYRTPGSGQQYSFADGEVPGGTINGSNLSFTLANTPNPASGLRLYKNGVLLQQNIDYTLNGSTITFSGAAATPQTGDSLSAYYRH